MCCAATPEKLEIDQHLLNQEVNIA